MVVRRGLFGTGEDRLLLLANISRLYYLEDLTQEAIARRIGTSRSNVSRMLKEARRRGVVEIKVHSPASTSPLLQEELAARLGLCGCVVFSGPVERDGVVGKGVAALAARYVQENLGEGVTLALGWGRSIYLFVHSGLLHETGNVTVVQMMGSIGGDIPELDGISATAHLAGILEANAHYLHAPMLVADSAVRDGLLRDPHVRRTLEVARHADLMVAGIGGINQDFGQYRAGYLDEDDLEYIRRQGVVGEVGGNYFTIEGRLRWLEMNERMIALDASGMRRIPLRIGISWGEGKILPNIGAARAGLINVLITDEDTASGMLRFLERGGRV